MAPWNGDNRVEEPERGNDGWIPLSLLRNEVTCDHHFLISFPKGVIALSRHGLRDGKRMEIPAWAVLAARCLCWVRSGTHLALEGSEGHMINNNGGCIACLVRCLQFIIWAWEAVWTLTISRRKKDA